MVNEGVAVDHVEFFRSGILWRGKAEFVDRPDAQEAEGCILINLRSGLELEVPVIGPDGKVDDLEQELQVTPAGTRNKTGVF